LIIFKNYKVIELNLLF